VILENGYFTALAAYLCPFWGMAEVDNLRFGEA
jgi:hypothetical protein